MVNTFEGLLAALVASQVRFTLVGGLAVSLNGFVRTTEDMDILVDDEPANIQALLDCLLNFGEGFARELNVSDFNDTEGAIRIQEDFDLDVFVRMRGNKYVDLAGHIRHHPLPDGTAIPYLDAAGLIRLKEGSLREKDRIDVSALNRTSVDSTSKEPLISLDRLRRPAAGY
jgi:hypothetical protein